MAEGRDEVGAARDWLERHGVVVAAGTTTPPGSAHAARRAGVDHATETGGAVGGGLDPGVDGGPDGLPRTSGEPEAAGSGGKRRAGGRSSRRRGPGGRRRSGDVPGGTAEEGVEVSAAPGGRRSPGGGTGEAGGAGGPDGSDADPEQVARAIVLRKLTAQSRTRAELERALRTKEVPEEAASAVLDRMGEDGLIDDAAFARDWVASRQQRRHLSRTALRRELQTKGVDRDVIDDALSDVDNADEHRAALDLAQRKASRMADLPREVAYRRLGGVLARRGFSGSVTGRVLSEVLDGIGEE